MAHWDMGNPAAPVSPKGDDQRRAFLTFTEVWGGGKNGGCLAWEISFDVYGGLLIGLGKYFLDVSRGCLRVPWEFLLVGLFFLLLW